MPIHLSNQSGDSIYHRGNTPPKSSVFGQNGLNFYPEPSRAYKGVYTLQQFKRLFILKKQMKINKHLFPFGQYHTIEISQNINCLVKK